MALVNNNITLSDNTEVICLLKEIICMLSGDDEKLRQEIYDKLDKVISDIKNTI